MTEREIEASVRAERLANRLFEEGMKHVESWHTVRFYCENQSGALDEIVKANALFQCSDYVRRLDKR